MHVAHHDGLTGPVVGIITAPGMTVRGGASALEWIQANPDGWCIAITKAEAQFMAACDLGPRWTELAQCPVLFEVGAENVGT